MSEYPEEVPGRVWMRGWLDREKEKLMAISKKREIEERKALYIANQAKMVRLKKERKMQDDNRMMPELCPTCGQDPEVEHPEYGRYLVVIGHGVMVENYCTTPNGSVVLGSMEHGGPLHLCVACERCGLHKNWTIGELVRHMISDDCLL